MPTARQYEILFLLKAQMDSAFGGSFQNARQQMSSMESEIKKYNQTMRDISAYQRHQQKLEALTQQLKNEEQELTLVRNQIKQNGTATKEQTTAETQHEAKLRALNKAIEEQKSKINQSREALEKNQISIHNLTEEEDKLRLKVEQLTAEEEKLAQMKSTIGGVSEALQGMQMMAMMAADAVKEVDSAIMTCIEGAGQLEYTMSGVTAVSGATEEERQRLTQTAKDLGATTVYTASEVANSLQTMGLAGADAEEMISGIPAVVNLAASAGEDLNTMTGIVMDGMSAFGLQGTNAVNEFSDTLAKAATSSNTTVSAFGESLSYVEGTAANLGYNIQDVSLALAVMANNSIKGSVSGSALNTTLTRMSGANETAAKEMDALGLSMYNADGTAKDLGTFLGELRTAFQGFGGDAQAAQVAAYNLAGQRGMRGLLSIVNTSDEEWRQMTEDIYNFEGAAGKIGDIRMDNYVGQVKLMESAWDALKTSIGEQFLPVGRSAAEVLTGIMDAANGVVQKSGPIIPMLAAGAQGILIVGGAVSVLTVGVGALNMALGTFGVTLGAFAAPLIGASVLIGGAAAVLTGIAYASDDANAEILELKETTQQLIAESEEATKSHDKMMESFAKSNEKTDGYISTLQKMIDKDGEVTASKESIQKVVDQLNEDIPGLGLEFDAASGKINKTADELRKFNQEITSSEVEQATDDLARLQGEYDSLQELLEKAEKQRDASEGTSTYTAMGGNYFVNTNYAEANQKAAELQAQMNEVQSDMQESQDILDQYAQQHADAMGVTVEAYEQYGAAMEEFQATFEQTVQDYREAYAELTGINKEAQDLEEKSASDVTDNLENQLQQWKDYRENLQEIVNSGIEIPDSMFADLASGTADAMENAKALAEGGTASIQEAADQIEEMGKIQDDVSNMVGIRAEGVNDQLQEMLSKIELSDDDLKKQAEKVGKTLVEGLGIGLYDDGTVSAKGEEISKSLIESIKNAASKGKGEEIGQDVDEGLISGMNDKKQEVTDKAGEVAKSARKEVKDTLSKKTFETYGKNAMQGVIDGVQSMVTQVVHAFSNAAQVAMRSYSSEQQINSPSKKFSWFSEMDFVGATEGARKNTYLIEDAMREAGQRTNKAYLEGQDRISISSAGTATVFDPRMIAAMQTAYQRTPAVSAERAIDGRSITNNSSSSGITVNYAPNITVNGNADAGAIRTLLRDDTGELRQMVRDAVYEIEDSERRWAY